MVEPDDKRDSGGSTEHYEDTVNAVTEPINLFEDRATHVTDAFEEMITLCRDTVRADNTLAYMAHYTVGVYDFSVDVLADIYAECHSVEHRREDYGRIGRQVAFAASNLDRTLEDVRTGTVIRLVLHASDGMLICCPVIPKEYVVALTVDPSVLSTAGEPLTELPGAVVADAATTDLVTACRNRLGLRTQDPGGWPPRSDDTETGSSQTSAAGLLHEKLFQHTNIPEPDQQSVADLCSVTIDPDDLHYVAHCRGADIISIADYLDHRQVSRFFTQISPEARRKFYGDFCRRLCLLAGQLGRVVAPAIGSPVERIVVDVQQGAIYYYRLRAGEYLVGVTLEQRGVEAADRKMAALAVRCAALPPDE